MACFYAVMIKTDYVNKDMFNSNFWKGFQEVLGKKHVIQVRFEQHSRSTTLDLKIDCWALGSRTHLRCQS